MSDRMIHEERRGGVALLRLEHGKVQALDVELCSALERSFRALEADRSVRAVVVTGTGRTFSAGVDLLRVLDVGPSFVRELLPRMEAAFEALFSFPKPLVGALNGHAIAGGCVIASACDRRIMARSGGRIGAPELLVGVPFPPIALEIVRFGVGPERCNDVVLRGRIYSAEEALAEGLVDELVEGAALVEAALRCAGAFAELPAEAFAFAKRHLRAPFLDRARALTATDGAAIRALWEAPETTAAIRAYVARTMKK